MLQGESGPGREGSWAAGFAGPGEEGESWARVGKRVGLGFGPVWVGFRVLGWFEMVWAFELDGLWV